MPVIIALLRAVNLAGHNKIRMEFLRGVFEAAGCRKVETLLQSGNVVCEVEEKALPKLAQRIEEAIENELAFRPRIIVRTITDLRKTVASAPFAGREGLDPAKLLVTFLAEDPSEEARRKVLAMDTQPEELHLRGREVHMYFPNGLGRPKTSPASIERALKVPGTGRNWATVTKLLIMAERLEASQNVSVSTILETSVPGDRKKTR